MKRILAVFVVGLMVAPVSWAAVINEIRIDQPGGDADQYFELAGTPGESLNGLTYIVIGDSSTGLPIPGGRSGSIEAVVDLNGLSFSSTNGFFLAAEATFTLGTPDLVTTLIFENSDNVSHLLVSGFTGAVGDLLDTDRDGVLDITPWTAVVDGISLIETPNPQTLDTNEHDYGFGGGIGPNGTFVPSHVYRSPDGGPWAIGEHDPTDPLAQDTPGASNPSFLPVNAEENVTVMSVGAVGASIPLDAADGLCGEGVGALTYVIDSIPSNGVLSQGIGPVVAALTYTPNAGYSGLDSFTYHVEDSQVPPQSSPTVRHELAVQSDGLVITEIMHSPSSFDSTYEFVEVYNAGGQPITLTRLDASTGTTIPTAGNLGGTFIIPGQTLLLAIDNTASFPASAEEFRCEWGELEAGLLPVSLFETDIVRVPLAQWEFLFANPDLDCTVASGSRVLVFGQIGAGPEVLLDAVDMSADPTGTSVAGSCFGSSYAKNAVPFPLTAAANDVVSWWQCSSDASMGAGRIKGVSGDAGSPVFVPTVGAPGYDFACGGSCCLQDATCTNGFAGADDAFVCQATGGTWNGPNSFCPDESGDVAAFVGCLSGPGVAPAPGCEGWDLDFDIDVDILDFAVFQEAVCKSFCTSIAQAPVMTFPNTTPVCITDAILSSDFDTVSSTAAKEFIIQDPVGTNGLTVYGLNADIDALLATAVGGPASAGSVIEIEGTLQAFFDAQEIIAPFTMTVLSSNGIPEPFSRRVADLAPGIIIGTNDGIISTLVILRNVEFTGAGGGATFTSGNHQVRDATTLQTWGPAGGGVRISGDTNPLPGQVIPTGTVDIIGVITTFSGAFNLKPRSMDDIGPSEACTLPAGHFAGTCIDIPAGACTNQYGGTPGGAGSTCP